MKKCVCILLVLFSCLCGCGKVVSGTRTFDTFRVKYRLPAGLTYDSAAAEWESGYLTRETFERLYARPDGSSEWEDIESCVIFLGASLDVTYEMGIFVCLDRAKAEEVAKMCYQRIDIIRSVRSYTDAGPAEDAIVKIYGTTVVLFVLPDNEKAERVMDRIL
ncbi:MAG: hypothetical protein WDA00_04240 [Eubacteriales bacterium]